MIIFIVTKNGVWETGSVELVQANFDQTEKSIAI